MNRLPHLLPRLLAAFVALAAIIPAGGLQLPAAKCCRKFCNSPFSAYLSQPD